MSKIDKPKNETPMQALQYVCTPDLVNDAKQIIGAAQNLPTVSAQFLQLSWSHYARLMRVANEEERNLRS